MADAVNSVQGQKLSQALQRVSSTVAAAAVAADQATGCQPVKVQATEPKT